MLEFELDKIYEKALRIVEKKTGKPASDGNRELQIMRLKEHLNSFKFNDLASYYNYLIENFVSESVLLTNIISDQFTSFFREPEQLIWFESFVKNIIETKKDQKIIRIWSIGCGAGHELYTIAMICDFLKTELNSDIVFQIVGSEIDLDLLEKSKSGIYHREELKTVPITYIKDHWSRGEGEIANFVRAKKSLKKFCQFQSMDLMDIESQKIVDTFDVIFCRNVLSLFFAEEAERIVLSLSNFLKNHGAILTGLFENIANPQDSNLILEGKDKWFKEKNLLGSKDQTKKIIKVMCVDDSQTVLTLLKKILVSENGFEVVGTAANGLEAMELYSKLKPDLVTLDIHMPKMTGLEYLEKNFNDAHVPVVMISSANRDDASTALKAFELGASDFIEKPSMKNLKYRTDEIRSKLRSAFYHGHKKVEINDVDKQFLHDIEIHDCEDMLRICIASMGDYEIISQFMRSLQPEQPPTIFLFENQESFLEQLADTIGTYSTFPIKYIESITELSVNQIYLADFQKIFPLLKEKYKTAKVSLGLFRGCTKEAENAILSWTGIHLLACESEDIDSKILERADDIFPVTSFPYVSTKYFAEG